ncbi:MAG: sensor histidine kinase [Myxococcota bacterium]
MLGPIHAFAAACFYVFGVIYLVAVDSPYLFAANGLFGTLCVANWYALRGRVAEHVHATTFLAVVYVGLVNVAGHLGREPMPMVAWGISVTIAAAFLYERRGVLAWSAITLLFYPLVAGLKAGPLRDRVIALDELQADLLAEATYVGLLSLVAYSLFLFRARIRAYVEERGRLEARLFRAQKLESLGVLAGGVAHDFNNLLTVVLGNVNLAQVHPLAAHPGVAEPLANAETAVLRAADLTHQMLAFAGKGQLAVDTVDLNRLLAELGEIARSSVPRRIDLRLALADPAPRVVADPSQVRQVVLNLLLNAAEAIGDARGEIVVRAEVRATLPPSTWTPTASAAGGWACIEVADTGCGMDEATQARVFDPFFTTKFTGRGLGLAAVLGIVKGHGGAVAMTSAPGRGTTFTVAFPSAAAVPG